MILKGRIRKIEKTMHARSIDMDVRLVSRAWDWLSEKGFTDMPSGLEGSFRRKPLAAWFKEAERF